MTSRQVKPALSVGLCLIGLLVPLDTASAQVWQRIGIGASIGISEPHDRDVESSLVIGGRGGLAPEPGWGFDASLGWFSADLFNVRGSTETRIGELRVRPLMGGIAYTWMAAGGRLATTASLTAGVSINGADLDDDIAMSGEGAMLEVGNSFAIRPGVEAEFFVTRKLALTAGLGYLYTRPEITYSTPTERITDRWDASAFTVLAGIVVYPFR